ncbi:hypothetical protein JCM8208_002213 [Rhodotorula glutinis]
MRSVCVLLLALLAALVRAQTAAPFPPLIYTYDGASAATSLLNAISTAGASAESILAASGTDTATGLVGAFPTTATVEDTNSPVAATSVLGFQSGTPGEVLSTATRAPYTKVGTVDTSMASATVGATNSPSSGAGRTGVPAKEVLLALGVVAVGALAGAGTLL